VTERERRLARNEALFRGVNEKVMEVKGKLRDREATFEIVCECGREDCLEQVAVTLAEYERVRAAPTHFIVKLGHELGEVERIVERLDRFVVIEKREEEATIARETDPRS
jgi:predicted NBD/HSP70 family sugar kinase